MSKRQPVHSPELGIGLWEFAYNNGQLTIPRYSLEFGICPLEFAYNNDNSQ
jgi:hypothetical protein